MTNQPLSPERHVVKRYSVGRFYDTSTLSYVDVAQLRALIRAGAEVVVLDAKSGKDITATALRLEH
jgi:polyhydroxyalkanoate synthesis regulator protein